jgi:signal transduction histidine kinase
MARTENLSRRALIQAARRVESGDLEAAIPLVDADETAPVAASFNRMLVGLKEREALRGENIELVEELRASRTRIVAASVDSRRRVERDLHDGAQQSLVLLDLRLGLLERNAEGQSDLAKLAAESRADLKRALGELRDLAHGIYPQILTSDGLPGALAEAASQAAIRTGFSTDGAGRYPAEVEAAVYFCCLEALQNAAKYAGEEAQAQIRLSEAGGELRFEVADNGVGFDATATSSDGMQNMADRIGAVGGELRVHSTPGKGTTISGAIPVEASTTSISSKEARTL